MNSESINIELRSIKSFEKVINHEKQIDQLVYKLYALTPEEIKIVEKK